MIALIITFYGTKIFIDKNIKSKMCLNPIFSKLLCQKIFDGWYFWLVANLDPRKTNYDRVFQNKPGNINIKVSRKDIAAYNKQVRLGIKQGFHRDEWKKWRKIDLDIGNQSFKNINMKLHGTSISHIRNNQSVYDKITKQLGINVQPYDKGLAALNASFKIKLKKDKFFNGVRRITLISIMDGWDASSVALTKIAQKLGIIVTSPSYNHIFFNGADAGIYLLSEEIDKELLERNYGITNYGILKSNDVWDKSLGGAHISLTDDTSYDKEQSGSKLAAEYALAKFKTLMTAVKRKDISKVIQLIDIEDFAKFSALENIYGTNHSSAGDNLRYLYDFSTGTFRLILRIENQAKIRKNLTDLSKFDVSFDGSFGTNQTTNKIFQLLITNKKFHQVRRQYLNYIINNISLLELEIENSIDRLLELSKRTSFDVSRKVNMSRLSWINLKRNLSYVERYLKSHKVYVTHVVTDSVLEILYESSFNLKVLGVVDCDNKVYNLSVPKIIQSNFFKKDWLTIEKIRIPKINCIKNLVLEGENAVVFPENILINIRSDFTDFETVYSDFRKVFKENVKSKGSNWFVKAGDYSINSTIMLPYGVNLILEPGVKIKLGPNVGILVRGDFTAVGGEEQIQIFSQIKDNPFSSVAVLGSSDKFSEVNLQNFHLWGGSEGIIDGVYFSGQMSIHRANVNIIGSEFSFSNSDDGINIKYSNVSIDNNRFFKNKADQLDCDMCTGYFKDNYFEGLIENIPGSNVSDGLDLSNSQVRIENNNFSTFSDKAISIGEKSKVQVIENLIEYSNIGIAVKDSSVAVLKGNKLNDNNQDKSKYIKKLMYLTPKVIQN